MDVDELKRIVLSFGIEQKKELVKQLIELKNEARGCIFTDMNWECGYEAIFERGDFTITRNIMIVESEESSALIENAIKYSSKSVEQGRHFNRLDCYAFCELDDAKRLIDIADYMYQIVLNIYDIDVIVNEVLSKESVLNGILPQIKDADKKNGFRKQDKIIYDLFTTGAKVADIKYSFVSSYIQFALYDHDEMPPVELRAAVKRSLKNLTEQVYDATIEQEMHDGHIEFPNKKFKLTATCRQDLDKIVTSTSQQEELLHQQLKECLSKYNLDSISSNVLGLIMALYKAYYDGELSPFGSEDKKIERDYGNHPRRSEANIQGNPTGGW